MSSQSIDGFSSSRMSGSFEVSGTESEGGAQATSKLKKAPEQKQVKDELAQASKSQSTSVKEKFLKGLSTFARVAVGSTGVAVALATSVPVFLVLAPPLALAGAIIGKAKLKSGAEHGAKLGLAIAALPLQATVRMINYTATLDPKEGTGKQLRNLTRPMEW